jgi:hypothetical protein
VTDGPMLRVLGYFLLGLAAATPAALLADGLLGSDRAAEAVFGAVWLAGVIFGAIKAKVLP